MSPFSLRYDNTIRDLERWLGELIDTGSEFDMERSGDVLTIEFEDGEKCVITPQAPLEQLWISANYAGHRFNWSEETQQWIHEKNHDSLISFLSGILSL